MRRIEQAERQGNLDVTLYINESRASRAAFDALVAAEIQFGVVQSHRHAPRAEFGQVVFRGRKGVCYLAEKVKVMEAQAIHALFRDEPNLFPKGIPVKSEEWRESYQQDIEQAREILDGRHHPYRKEQRTGRYRTASPKAEEMDMHPVSSLFPVSEQSVKTAFAEMLVEPDKKTRHDNVWGQVKKLVKENPHFYNLLVGFSESSKKTEFPIDNFLTGFVVGYKMLDEEAHRRGGTLSILQEKTIVTLMEEDLTAKRFGGIEAFPQKMSKADLEELSRRIEIQSKMVLQEEPALLKWLIPFLWKKPVDQSMATACGIIQSYRLFRTQYEIDLKQI